MRPRSIASALLGPLVLGAIALAGSPSHLEAGAAPVATWVELGPNGAVLARTVTRDAACPQIAIDRRQSPMQIHAPRSAAFPALVCEATLPDGTVSATIDGLPLPVPGQSPSRITVLGDTGCRVSVFEGKEKIQDCTGPSAWPAAQVANSAAATRPDLIIHVGDYIYRESPCPAAVQSCANQTYGDNLDTWIADFFQPEAALFAAAPIVFERGNHEDCDREGDGWFRFLDPRPLPDRCLDYTDPYQIPVGGLQLLMLDSAFVSDDFTINAQHVEQMRPQFQALQRPAGPNAWLLTHSPMWVFGHLGIKDGKEDLFRDNETLWAASNHLLPAGVQLVISGHIHLFESPSFPPGRAPQLVVGNGGTALDPVVTTPLAGLEIDGGSVDAGAIDGGFGFSVLDAAQNGWRVTYRDASGATVGSESLSGQQLIPDR